MWDGELVLKLTEVVRVDSKGRVTIPMIMRESLNIVEGMHVILIADTSKREIIISPLVPPRAKVYEIYLELKDEPGVLAKVAGKLAEFNIDLITSHCTTIKRGETAECVLVADFSQANYDPERVRQEIVTMPFVKLAIIKPLRSSRG